MNGLSSRVALPSLHQLLLLAVLAAGAVVGRSALSAQDAPPYVGQVRRMETEQLTIAHPAGLAFAPAANAFLVLEALPPASGGTEVKALTPSEDFAGTTRLPVTVDARINVAFDGRRQRLLLYQAGAATLLAMAMEADGAPDPATVTGYEAGQLGLVGPQGMAVDPATGDLYVLDRGGSRLVRVTFSPDGGLAEASVTAVSLQGLRGLRGLAWHPGRGHLFAISPETEQLVEVTVAGQVVAKRDLSGFGLRQPQGMVFAPSGDQTDDPAELSLYVADSGLAQAVQGAVSLVSSRLAQETASGGTIMELTLTEPTVPEATASLTLVQTIQAWQWDPPSPDSAGVAYLEHRGTLMVSDSEVNEMPNYFTGVNLFEATLGGDLVATFTTIDFSNEPTGIDVNPANRHLFISDDTGTRSVYQLNPGPDGLYNTADDIVTSFATEDFGSDDPEGVAYDSWFNALFVTDGVNREVYRVAPGANGVFDGVPPTGDDQVTHFDTLGLGVDDPEGIAFNSDNGNLYIVSRDNVLAEVTTSGSMVQTFDITISADEPHKPAGLAYAPGSQDPNVRNIYVAARGVDNGKDPDENDGKVYEFALPGSTSNTPTPTATGTPTSTPTSTPTVTPTATPVAACTTPVISSFSAVLAGSDVQLEWSAEGADTYELWWSADPYFAVGADCAAAANCALADSPYLHLQAADSNYSYELGAINSCGDKTWWSADSGHARPGTFTFELVPGSSGG